MSVCAKCNSAIQEESQGVKCRNAACLRAFHLSCAKLKEPPRRWFCSTACSDTHKLSIICFVVNCKLELKRGEKTVNCSGPGCQLRRHELCVAERNLCTSCVAHAGSNATCGKCDKPIDTETQENYSCLACDEDYHKECMAEGDMYCIECKITKSQVTQRKDEMIAKQKKELDELQKMAEESIASANQWKEQARRTAETAAANQDLLKKMREELDELKKSKPPKPPVFDDRVTVLKSKFFDMRNDDPDDEFDEREQDIHDSFDDDLKEFLNPNPCPDGTSEAAVAYKYRKHGYHLPKFTGDTREWPAFRKRFMESTVKGNFTDCENADRLRDSLTSDAVKFAGPDVKFSDSGAEIMRNLAKHFGRAEVLSVRLADALLEVKKCNTITDYNLIDFSVQVSTYVRTVKSLEWEGALNNNYLLNKLEQKLCDIHCQEWYSKKRRIELRDKETGADLEDFAAFLNIIATRFPIEFMVKRDEKKRDDGRREKPKHLNLHQSPSFGNPRPKRQCHKCEGTHMLVDCPTFLKLGANERHKFVFGKKICSRCLSKKQHDFSRCDRHKCSECSGRHHEILHGADAYKVREQKHDDDERGPKANLNLHQTSLQSTSDVLHKVLPIRIRKRDGSFLETFALLDDCAGITMIDEKLFDNLGVSFHDRKWLTVFWTTNVKRKNLSKRADIEISSSNGDQRLTLKNVYTCKDLSLLRQSFNAKEMKERYKHLRGLDLPDLDNAQPLILIGLRHSKTMIVQDNRLGQDDDDPVASKTPLGWTVWGATVKPEEIEFSPQASHYHVGQIYCHQVDEGDNQDKIIDSMVREYFSSEDFGFIPRDKLVGVEVKRAIDIMSSSIKFEDGHYSMKLPWRSDDVKLPDNFASAVHRMELDEKRVEKLNLQKFKSDLFKDYLSKGYIRKAMEQDLMTKWDRVWYCPHFVTFNMNKIPPKPRNVFDAAAKTRGVSLNTHLLTGPDNLAPLTRSLIRLRENRIAFVGDIKEMFPQIRIQSPDDQCQRFLFRDGDRSMDPRNAIWIMQSMMFGPTSSPAQAQFAKNFHAEKYRVTHPKAYDVITKFTYVDDSSDSQPTIDEAFDVARSCIEIYKEGGFDLRSSRHSLQ